MTNGNDNGLAGRARHWLRSVGYRRRPATSEESSCVIIGPVASGKSALLYSLRRSEKAMSHSYTGLFDVTVNGLNDHFKRYDALVPDYFRHGLDFETSVITSFFRPEFAITAAAKVRITPTHGSRRRRYQPGDMQQIRFSTFDGNGGLLLESREQVHARVGDEQSKNDYEQARAALMTDLENCGAFVICLPIDAPLNEKEENSLADYLFQFRQDGKYDGRDVVVCFTKYEKCGKDLGRDAYRRLATPSEARRQMGLALREQAPGILMQLKQFNATPGHSVWCAPVSTYGFIPNHGGANYDPITGLLRTRAHRRGEAPSPEQPYAETHAFRRLWYPFLTLDPFIFIATGVREHTLIHHLDEVL